MVAWTALPAFEAISADPESTHTYLVCGEALKDSEARFLFLRLVGTKENAAGNATISW